MKLLNKEEGLFLSKHQWRKVFTAVSIMTLVVYAIAMVFSLCGSDIFILNYQNAQMDRIEAFCTKYNLMHLVNYAFMSVEFTICLWFVLNRRPRIWYLAIFYIPPMLIQYFVVDIPSVVYTIYAFVLYLTLPLIEQLLSNKHIEGKAYLFQFIRVLIAFVVTLLLEFMITTIKGSFFDGQNHIYTIAIAFCYAMENDIALSIMLFTIALFLDREKGDSKVCQKKEDLTLHNHSGSSQTSQTNLQKQSTIPWSNLPKTTKNKIRLIYIRTYIIQLGAFLLVIALPFILGKVFEFLVMYLSFVIVRYILGFNYSLHFKKEILCVGVSVLVFGILSLAVPFFYVVIILAILLGTGLAVILHLSYKYKGMFLFMEVANRDRYALLYVYFDGDLSEKHVKSICKMKGLEENEYNLLYDFVCRNKLSVIAHRYNYSERSISYKLDEYINKLVD